MSVLCSVDVRASIASIWKCGKIPVSPGYLVLICVHKLVYPSPFRKIFTPKVHVQVFISVWTISRKEELFRLLVLEETRHSVECAIMCSTGFLTVSGIQFELKSHPHQACDIGKLFSDKINYSRLRIAKINYFRGII